MGACSRPTPQLTKGLPLRASPLAFSPQRRFGARRVIRSFEEYRVPAPRRQPPETLVAMLATT
jgi:hypothetical protein